MLLLLAQIALALGLPGASAPARLTDSPFAASRPVWSPDATRIAYLESGDFGWSVAVARVSDGLPIAAGPSCVGVVGPPLWLDEGVRVGWLDDRARWWVLSCEGDLSVRRLPSPDGPVGHAPWPARASLLVYGEREVVTYATDGGGEPRPLALATANSTLTRVSAMGEELLAVDAGAVRLWAADRHGAPLLEPADEVAEYVSALPCPGARLALVTARSLTAGRPDRLSLLELDTGAERLLRFDGPIDATVPAHARDRAVVESDGALWWVGVAVEARRLTPEGRTLAFAGEPAAAGGAEPLPAGLYLVGLPAD